MAKPFLIVQLRPEDNVADSELRAIMRYGALTSDRIVRARADRDGVPDVDLDDFSAIIVGGSPFDVSTPEHEKSARQHDIEAGFMTLFERIATADFPFFGACSGNGLLGRFCGASISGRYAEPVGGADIHLTPDGREDPLLFGFPDTFRVLLGHKEACDDVPPGTVLLATSDTCPVQMFRLHNNVYATQFHPEADAEEFRIRIDAYRHHGYFAPEAAEALTATVADEQTPFAQLLLRRFVERYRDTD
jgi:GMP synthase (glutamine-hydrolysing)